MAFHTLPLAPIPFRASAFSPIAPAPRPSRVLSRRSSLSAAPSSTTLAWPTPAPAPSAPAPASLEPVRGPISIPIPASVPVLGPLPVLPVPGPSFKANVSLALPDTPLDLSPRTVPVSESRGVSDSLTAPGVNVANFEDTWKRFKDSMKVREVDSVKQLGEVLKLEQRTSDSLNLLLKMKLEHLATICRQETGLVEKRSAIQNAYMTAVSIESVVERSKRLIDEAERSGGGVGSGSGSGRGRSNRGFRGGRGGGEPPKKRGRKSLF